MYIYTGDTLVVVNTYKVFKETIMNPGGYSKT